MYFESTRTLLFGIFVVAGRRLTTAQLIALARPLGISATNVKSHLTRMVADGALVRSGPVRRARYWPSRRKAKVVERINARLQKAPKERWDGTWLMLTMQMPANRARRDRLQAALWFDGFRPLASSTFIRPAWPKRWAQSMARKHVASATGVCLRGNLLVGVDTKRVSAMYGLDSLDREVSRLARWINARRIPRGSGSKAFAARLRVGGFLAPLVSHDPRLPPAIWGGRSGLRELVRAFHRFEARIAPSAQRFLDEVIGRR